MSRYIPNTYEQQAEMLKETGFKSIDDLFDDIPEGIRFKGRLDLPGAMSEMELVKHMQCLALQNKNLDEYICFLGAGSYDHYVPAVIKSLISRQEFYTAYTPYQPEISQGTLQAIFGYQTMICELTGMDVANASMYDGATALAEAVSMACQVTGRKYVVIPHTMHPESRGVVKTYARFNGINIKETGYDDGQTDFEELCRIISEDTAAVAVQNPNFFGAIEDLKQAAEIAHSKGALLIAYVDPVSLGILKSPGELGADIVVGEGQSLGNSLSFGGPYLGFFAARKNFLRKMPGRIVGQTTDNSGKRGFVLTVQTREQHIRREKATSNICSNQALNALSATIYLSVMGPGGLKKVGEHCVEKSHYAYEKLLETGKFSPCFKAPFFKEFVLKSTVPVEKLNSKLLEEKIIGGYDLGGSYPELAGTWLVAVTETRTREEIDMFVRKAGAI